MPSLLLDGRTIPVLHVTQIAEALGLPPPLAARPLRDARDAIRILAAWLAAIRDPDWEALLAPTPARDRSLRNLTVNVFHPFELLPRAWTSGEFDWRPEEDAAREAELDERSALVGFAEAAAAGWGRFVDERGSELVIRDPQVRTPRGPLAFSSLLSFQRWHGAYHYRQLASVLDVGTETIASLDDLRLPAEVF